jgi:hypothetical protein
MNESGTFKSNESLSTFWRMRLMFLSTTYFTSLPLDRPDTTRSVCRGWAENEEKKQKLHFKKEEEEEEEQQQNRTERLRELGQDGLLGGDIEEVEVVEQNTERGEHNGRVAVLGVSYSIGRKKEEKKKSGNK